MTSKDFVSTVKAIAATNPTYRTGGDGSDGTCDCIGLIIGALGKKYDLHSSNYFARYQMRTIDRLQGTAQLHPGAIVYKSRSDTSQLHARYQQGGSYHNGDLLDYYHVGVVTGIAPFEITHCTRTNSINGIACDNSISTWSHFGGLLDVEQADEDEPASVPAVVIAANGSTVRMRSRPDTGAPTLAKVPVGADVSVIDHAQEWSQIAWNGMRGYMMSQFIQVTGAGETVTITIGKSAAAEMYKALQSVL